MHRIKVRRDISALCLLTLLLACAAGLRAQSGVGDLRGLWQQLEGKVGTLEQADCLYRFRPSRPTQVGNATIAAVRTDHLVIVEKRDGKTHEYAIPFERIVLITSR